MDGYTSIATPANRGPERLPAATPPAGARKTTPEYARGHHAHAPGQSAGPCPRNVPCAAAARPDPRPGPAATGATPTAPAASRARRPRPVHARDTAPAIA